MSQSAMATSFSAKPCHFEKIIAKFQQPKIDNQFCRLIARRDWPKNSPAAEYRIAN